MTETDCAAEPIPTNGPEYANPKIAEGRAGSRKTEKREQKCISLKEETSRVCLIVTQTNKKAIKVEMFWKGKETET
jgi:hypothetical protein